MQRQKTPVSTIIIAGTRADNSCGATRLDAMTRPLIAHAASLEAQAHHYAPAFVNGEPPPSRILGAHALPFRSPSRVHSPASPCRIYTISGSLKRYAQPPAMLPGLILPGAACRANAGYSLPVNGLSKTIIAALRSLSRVFLLSEQIIKRYFRMHDVIMGVPGNAICRYHSEMDCLPYGSL